jgi:hypothetical protein
MSIVKFTPEMYIALTDALKTAMVQNMKARIPEAGMFSEIAQNLSYVVSKMEENIMEDQEIYSSEIFKSIEQRLEQECKEKAKIRTSTLINHIKTELGYSTSLMYSPDEFDKSINDLKSLMNSRFYEIEYNKIRSKVYDAVLTTLNNFKD